MSNIAVTARRATREVKTVVTQKQDVIVLEMPLEVAMTLQSAIGSISSCGPRRAMMADVCSALAYSGVISAHCFTGWLHEIP